MAEHHFDIDIAEKYGVNAAIILDNMYFWIKKNEANNVNFYDGCYWTYNSVKAFCDLFPYLSKSQITTALKKLEAAGVIKTGNYNKSAYDRTTWYAFTEMGNKLLGIANNKNQKSISDFNEMDYENNENGNSTNSEPIPDNNTYINTYNITDTNTMSKTPETENAGGGGTPQKIVEMFHSICKSYPKVRSISENRKKAIQARLRTYGYETIKEVYEKAEASDFLKGKNNNNWSADFDWIMTDGNFAKILDGKYQNRTPKKSENYEPDYLCGWDCED